MVLRFKSFINEHNLFSADDLLILAVSGGVDSVVLVDLCKNAGYRFVIAHMNFNLRAEESKRDELFVRELAIKNQAELFVKDVDAATFAAEKNLSIQEAARVLRYDWFELLRGSLAEQTNPKPVNKIQAKFDSDTGKGRMDKKQGYILTAHHKDDSVETMMMNLFRGTGIVGLRGIEPVNGKIIRPMLGFTRDEILSYAGEQDLTWVEDSSNQLDKYTRNYFRNQFIPMLKGIYPQVEQNLYHNLERFEDAVVLYRESVEKRIKKLIELRGSEVQVPVRKLLKQTSWQTILFELLQPYNFSAGQVSQVAGLVGSETGRQVISEKFRVIKNRNWLIIAPVAQESSGYLLIEKADKVVSFAGGGLAIEIVERVNVAFDTVKQGVPADNAPHIAYIDADKTSFPLLLRKHKAGDYFYPLGMKKKKKIARFMIDIKLSKTQKEAAWILEANGKILWLVGHRIDDRFKISPSTKSLLKVTRTF